MPLYTGDYLRDTRGLSMSEHGAYLLLLTFSWDSKGPVPLDERECAGICNARSGDELEAVRRVLNRFFVRMDDGWYNPRMQKEVERAEAISRARSVAGRKGFQAIAKQLPGKSPASASTPTPTLTPTTITREKPLARAERSPAELTVVESLPLRDGTQFPVRRFEVQEFESAYPQVDIPATLREMRAWLIANPDRRKTRRGCLRFVNHWLANEQRRLVEV